MEIETNKKDLKLSIIWDLKVMFFGCQQKYICRVLVFVYYICNRCVLGRNTPLQTERFLWLGTYEVKLLIVRMFYPLMLTSSFHGSRQITDILLSIFLPVIIFDDLITDPEPELQRAGVAQPEPHVGRWGVLGFDLDPFLVPRVSDRDQVIVVLSAVN